MKTEVRDTAVMSAEEVRDTGGSWWKRVEIGWDDFDYVPGQYVMAAKKEAGVNWPSPLMIQARTPGGFVVFIHSGHGLEDIGKPDALTVWGPCGTGVETGDHDMVISDQAGRLLIHPFLQEKNHLHRTSYVLGCDYSPADLLKEWESDETGQNPLKQADIQLIAALPLSLLRLWKEQMPSCIRSRTKVFTGVKVGCGIGACRGCYIHGGDGGQGIPVCQKGPFLPLDDVDYEKDQNFLMHFVSAGGEGR